MEENGAPRSLHEGDGAAAPELKEAPQGASAGQANQDEDDEDKAEEAPESKSPGDAEKALVEALRAFIKNEGLPKPAESKRLTVFDALWLVLILICLAMVVGLIPEAVFKSGSGKLVLDKIVPWFLNFGALAAVLKSPDTVLAATRNGHLRGIVLVVLLFFAILTRPLFTVVADTGKNTTLWLDGKRITSKFTVNLGHHDFEVRSDDSKIQPRQFSLEFADFLHGLEIQPRWHLVYTVGVDLDEPMKVCFEPNFKIDDDFLIRTGDKFARSNKQALEFDPKSDSGFNVPLLAGRYKVTGFLAGCGVTAGDQFLLAGSGAPTDAFQLPAITCVKAPQKVTDPCDGHFQKGGK